MPNTDCELIAELKVALISQRYSPVVAGNYLVRNSPFARAYLAEWVAYGRMPEHKQPLQLNFDNGALHALQYQMEQIDGDWRIAGVRFAPAPQVSA